jgi:hypothetical protein
MASQKVLLAESDSAVSRASALRFLIAAAALAATQAHAGVFGEMKGFAPPAGERKYPDVILKPVDLKSCVVDAYSIDTADALFDAERPKLDGEREELKKLDAAASGKRPGDPAAIEMRARARAFNAKVAALNSRVAYAQEARDRFSSHCKGRGYYFPDLEAVRAQLPAEIGDRPLSQAK